MKMWMERFKSVTSRRFAAAFLAVAVVGSVAMLSLTNSVKAAPAPTPAAAGLDDNSVGALLTLDRAMETLAARVTPAVVNVTVASKPNQQQAGQDGMPDMQQFFGPSGPGGQGGPFGRQFNFPQQPQNRMEHGLGSGVIISPDGYIVTNNHVIDGAMDIRVTMSDRRILPAKLIGADPLTDLAVIKIDGHDLPSIPWGDSSKLHPGQTVLAFGSPFGYFQFSVTRGIISALDRPNPYTDDPRKPGDFIQTDAAINRGNSGGPLVDSHGELVGINTFIISDSGSFAGAGFAIPAGIARASAESIIKTGTVHHGYLGISMNDVTPENSQFFNLPDATGAIVSQVTPDSPAGHAGLKSGDVLR